jgi:hypothetical protein
MSSSRFELLGAATPLGHHKDSPTLPKNQDARRIPRTRRWQQRARRPRSRICLLKGCGPLFRPHQPIARYCSDGCRAKAHQRYRQSPNGKQKRQAQSRRYRARRKELPARETAAVSAARVITPKFFSCSCDRPGCYVEFDRTRRSPCSISVRQPVARLWSAFWSGRGTGANDGWSRSRGKTPE